MYLKHQKNIGILTYTYTNNIFKYFTILIISFINNNNQCSLLMLDNNYIISSIFYNDTKYNRSHTSCDNRFICMYV